MTNTDRILLALRAAGLLAESQAPEKWAVSATECVEQALDELCLTERLGIVPSEAAEIATRCETTVRALPSIVQAMLDAY